MCVNVTAFSQSRVTYQGFAVSGCMLQHLLHLIQWSYMLCFEMDENVNNQVAKQKLWFDAMEDLR